MTMGLFHKTLKDIKKKVEHGEYNIAKRFLDEHIAAEHHFQSDLSGLQGAISAYQQQLRNLQGWWNLTNDAPKSTKASLPKFFAMIDEAEKQLISVKAIISKLRRDAKIKLE